MYSSTKEYRHDEFSMCFATANNLTYELEDEDWRISEARVLEDEEYYELLYTEIHKWSYLTFGFIQRLIEDKKITPEVYRILIDNVHNERVSFSDMYNHQRLVARRLRLDREKEINN